MRTIKLLMTSVATVFVLALGTSSSVYAQTGSGPNPYRDCGIGAALFPETTWAAVSSNVIWDIGTTAVISATASPETCQGSAAAAAHFINQTYDMVVEATARGEGSHLVALLEIYGCNTQSQAGIVDAIRSDVGARIADDDYSALEHVEKAEQYFLILDGEIRANHSASCSAA
ncbi:MAG: DUF3015 family protein [Pseudomonadota bacterium]